MLNTNKGSVLKLSEIIKPSFFVTNFGFESVENQNYLFSFHCEILKNWLYVYAHETSKLTKVFRKTLKSSISKLIAKITITDSYYYKVNTELFRKKVA